MCEIAVLKFILVLFVIIIQRLQVSVARYFFKIELPSTPAVVNFLTAVLFSGALVEKSLRRLFKGRILDDRRHHLVVFVNSNRLPLVPNFTQER